MAKMTKFMVFHNAPDIQWENVEKNWRKLAEVEDAEWIRTYYNKEKGMRYCLWLAPSEKKLKNIFDNFSVNFETITAVEETVPDLWGRKRWKEHLAADAKADTLAF